VCVLSLEPQRVVAYMETIGKIEPLDINTSN
jgi:hypothetical protein